MNCLARNPWPGNVRELSNLLERLAVLFPEQTVTADDLPERYRNRGAAGWVGSGVSIAPSPATVAEAEPFVVVPLARVEDSLAALDVTEIMEIVEIDAAEAGNEAEDVVDATLPRGGIDLKNH